MKRKCKRCGFQIVPLVVHKKRARKKKELQQKPTWPVGEQ